MIIHVRTIDELQAALDTVKPGDAIELDADIDFAVSFTVKGWQQHGDGCWYAVIADCTAEQPMGASFGGAPDLTP